MKAPRFQLGVLSLLLCPGYSPKVEVTESQVLLDPPATQGLLPGAGPVSLKPDEKDLFVMFTEWRRSFTLPVSLNALLTN